MLSLVRKACPFAGSLLFAACLTDPARAGDVPGVAPNLYEHGNVRVAVTCAESFATPDQGLSVTLDDAAEPLEPIGVNGVTSVALDSNDQPVVLSATTDVGFSRPRWNAPPAHRDPRLRARHSPGRCLRDARRAHPRTGPAGPFAMRGDLLQWSTTLRVGARLPLQYFDIAAGSGIGAALWIVNKTTIDSEGVSQYDVQATSPQPIQAVWRVPLWASATIKPLCNWGVQALASYDVEPTNLDGNALVLGAGLIWQPSSSCSEEPGISVSP